MTHLEIYKTKLQKAFARSRIVKTTLRDVLADEGMHLNRHDAFLTECCDIIAGTLPDYRIKELLYTFLLNDEPTLAERDEALRLLELSETALTTEQLQALQNEFNLK